MQIDTDEDYAKFIHPHFSPIVQRSRDEIELQMADENLKLKAMSLQLKNFDVENSMKQESLEKRYQGSIQELENQKRRFMDQVEQVRLKYYSDGCSMQMLDESWRLEVI